MQVTGERNRNSRGFSFRDGQNAPEEENKQPEPARVWCAKTALMCALGGVAFALTLLVKLAETAT